MFVDRLPLMPSLVDGCNSIAAWYRRSRAEATAHAIHKAGYVTYEEAAQHIRDHQTGYLAVADIENRQRTVYLGSDRVYVQAKHYGETDGVERRARSVSIDVNGLVYFFVRERIDYDAGLVINRSLTISYPGGPYKEFKKQSHAVVHTANPDDMPTRTVRYELRSNAFRPKAGNNMPDDQIVEDALASFDRLDRRYASLRCKTVSIFYDSEFRARVGQITPAP